MQEAERVDAYQAAVKRMEPDIFMVDRDVAIASIAISLRRIADALESPALAEKIERAISSGIWQGAQSAEWKRSR